MRELLVRLVLLRESPCHTGRQLVTRTMPAGHGGTEGKRYAQPTNSVQRLWSASLIKVIERSATWAWNMQSPKIINSNPNLGDQLVKSVR